MGQLTISISYLLRCCYGPSPSLLCTSQSPTSVTLLQDGRYVLLIFIINLIFSHSFNPTTSTIKMRTSFFAVALCAATAIAAPRGRHLSKVVNQVESEVSDVESSLKTRHVHRPGKKLVNEVENEVSSLGVRTPLDTSIVSEAEDEVDSLTGFLGVRAPLDTSIVNEAEDEVDSLTGSLGVRTPLDTSIVSEAEDEVDSLTESLGVRAPLDTSIVNEAEDEVDSLTGSLGVRTPLDTSIVNEAEDEVDSLTGSLGVRTPLDTSVVSEVEVDVEDEVEDLTQFDTSNLGVRDDTALLDKVVNQVDKIVDLDIPSADKLQRILNTIVDEIQARDAAEKRSLSLSHISLPGLDLSALDNASVDELLSDLRVLLQRLVKVVDPSEVRTVKQLIRELKDTTSEVENDLGLGKRSLLGLDMAVIDSLSLDSLVDDVDAIVACAEKAINKEVQSVSPSLAEDIRSLLNEITSLTSSL